MNAKYWNPTVSYDATAEAATGQEVNSYKDEEA